MTFATYCICLRMVRAKRTKKYTTRMGQYTGTSNISKKVAKTAKTVARVADSLCLAVRRHKSRTGDVVDVPELPLRQPPDEGAELVVALRGQRRGGCLVSLLKLIGKQIILK